MSFPEPLLSFSSSKIQDRVESYAKVINSLERHQKNTPTKGRLVSNRLTKIVPEASLLSNLKKLEHKADFLLSRQRLEVAVPLHQPSSLLCTASLKIKLNLQKSSHTNFLLTASIQNIRCPYLELSSSDIHPSTLLESVTINLITLRTGAIAHSFEFDLSQDVNLFEFTGNEKGFVFDVSLQPLITGIELFKPSDVLLNILAQLIEISQTRGDPAKCAVTLPQAICGVVKYCQIKRLFGEDMNIRVLEDPLISNLLAPHPHLPLAQLAPMILGQLSPVYPIKLERKIYANDGSGLFSVTFECQPFKSTQDSQFSFLDSIHSVEDPLDELLAVDEAISLGEFHYSELQRLAENPVACLSSVVDKFESCVNVVDSLASPLKERSGEVFKENPEVATFLVQRMQMFDKAR
ncbi:hypothetical protein RCL1_005440 [Eukaryota sp. TZLM3-RCL]